MQLVDTLPDIHPDKLIGVLRSHMRSGRIDEVRQAMPALIDKHPTLKNDLAIIMAQLKSRPASDDEAPAIELIVGSVGAVIACANCGGTVSRQSPQSIQVICQYCGCDSELSQPSGLSRWRERLQVNDKFTIGSRFEYYGTQWQAIGVQRYTGTIKEWDNEDDIWETNPANYTLWWMINAKREVAWLSDFGKKRYWSQKYLPKKPALPAKNDKTIEYGRWSLKLAAGEFSYQPQPNEQRHTFELTRLPRNSEEARKDNNGNAITYTVEAHIGSDGKATEYEFVNSVSIDDKLILQGIGAGDTLKAIRGWVLTGWLLFAGGVVAGSSFLAWKTLMPSTNVWRQSITLNDQAPVSAGELQVSEAGELYRISAALQGGLPTNTWTGIDVDITDSDGEYAGGYYVEFWAESGTDSDGYWSESKTHTAENLRFDEPGNYEVSATLSGTTASLPAKLDLSVSTHPFSIVPFAVAAGTGVFLGLLSFMRSSSRAASGATLGASLASSRRKTTTGKKTKARPVKKSSLAKKAKRKPGS